MRGVSDSSNLNSAMKDRPPFWSLLLKREWVPSLAVRAPSRSTWQNSSVTAFAAGFDPVKKMQQVASSVALEAIQNGWEGPPYDPFHLAEILKIRVVPKEEVMDARIVPLSTGKFQIEFNPNRPKQRIRYSIAHEIAHTFFRDCAERVRYRSQDRTMPGEWELEMLCNVGAAELLMPTGSFSELKDRLVTVEDVLRLRKEYEVSVESLALRYIKVTDHPAAVFVASKKTNDPAERYHVDYGSSSRSWPIRLPTGMVLPERTIVGDCTAIGFTAKATETWKVGELAIECVGIPPYPNGIFPRVVGIARPTTETTRSTPKLQVVKGDATEPRGTGVKILAHIVNDKTPNWGAGFGRVVRETWPPLQEDFRRWVADDPNRLSLGHTFFGKIRDDFYLAPMICQHGYAPSVKQKLRYAVLKDCLEQVATKAAELNATVHMPKIGTGYGGGSWGLIEPLIDESLCRAGISVTVYELPDNDQKISQAQRSLFDR